MGESCYHEPIALIGHDGFLRGAGIRKVLVYSLGKLWVRLMANAQIQPDAKKYFINNHKDKLSKHDLKKIEGKSNVDRSYSHHIF